MTKKYLKTPEEVIKALKEGKEVRDKYGSICKLVDGIIISKLNDFFEIGKPIRSVNKPYILEEEPLKIEVGKFYKTRCGKKAIILGKEDVDDGFPIHVALMDYYANAFYVSVSGRYNINGSDNELDLISPWED